MEKFSVLLFDFATGEKLDVEFDTSIRPNVGEEIFYWKDEAPAESRQFMIRRIRHDVCLFWANDETPPDAYYTHTLECFVHELRQRGEDDPVG